MESKKRRKYSEETLRNALAAISKGGTIRSVSQSFGIPKTTLLYKHKGKIPIGKNMGPPPVLSQEEEAQLVSWMIDTSNRGFAVTKTQLSSSVELLIKQTKRVTPFKDGRPGRHWNEGFLRRHPEMSEKLSDNVAFSRSSLSEPSLREWFVKTEKFLIQNNLADIDKSRIFNCEETAFFLNPRGEQVLIKKGERAAHNMTTNDTNESLTTLFMANASGILAPPMVVLRYERIPSSILQSIHQSWGISKSDDGWMTGESFFNYIVDVFVPWLTTNEIQRPIVLYIDGRSSHLTMGLSDFCKRNDIELVALYPNATHIIQPLEVAFFHPLRDAWGKAAHQWQINNDGKRMRKENFASVLVQALSTLNISEIIPCGFRSSGLCPFSANAITYEAKVKQHKVAKQKAAVAINNFSTNKESSKREKEIQKHLSFFEDQIDQNLLVAFKEAESTGKWDGNVKDENLFLFWLRLQRLAGKNSCLYWGNDGSLPAHEFVCVEIVKCFNRNDVRKYKRPCNLHKYHKGPFRNCRSPVSCASMMVGYPCTVVQLKIERLY